MRNEPGAIILFDGVCNLCNAAVQLVIKHDPAGFFHFASLKSDAGRALLDKYGLPQKTVPESLVLIEKGKARQYSAAALGIARHLNSWHRILYPFIFLPAFLRDPVYKFIARNRYRWWGKQESCWLPSPDLKARFL